MTNPTLRIGILGAARIAPNALLRPARRVEGVEVVAVAARDPARSRTFAQRWQIPQVHEDYEALIADPNIDAIYNPLPNSLHAEWSMRALRAGKHVLCEKPIASNACESRQMAAVAKETGLVLMEAFHNLYHPLLHKMKGVIARGELGTIRHIEAHYCTLLRRFNDIRYRYDLAGGATMDLGCYPLRLMRELIGTTPHVTSARAICSSPQVDRWMEANLLFPSAGCFAGNSLTGGMEITGRMTCAFYSLRLIRMSAKVIGDAGEMHVLNPIVPHLWNELEVEGKQGKYFLRVQGESSYTYQLRSFVNAIQNHAPIFSDAEDGVVNMQLIDEVYRKAGLSVRGCDKSQESRVRSQKSNATDS